jgi:hypothetical protein
MLPCEEAHFLIIHCFCPCLQGWYSLSGLSLSLSLSGSRLSVKCKLPHLIDLPIWACNNCASLCGFVCWWMGGIGQICFWEGTADSPKQTEPLVSWQEGRAIFTLHCISHFGRGTLCTFTLGEHWQSEGNVFIFRLLADALIQSNLQQKIELSALLNSTLTDFSLSQLVESNQQPFWLLAQRY